MAIRLGQTSPLIYAGIAYPIAAALSAPRSAGICLSGQRRKAESFALIAAMFLFRRSRRTAGVAVVTTVVAFLLSLVTLGNGSIPHLDSYHSRSILRPRCRPGEARFRIDHVEKPSWRRRQRLGAHHPQSTDLGCGDSFHTGGFAGHPCPRGCVCASNMLFRCSWWELRASPRRALGWCGPTISRLRCSPAFGSVVLAERRRLAGFLTIGLSLFFVPPLSDVVGARWRVYMQSGGLIALIGLILLMCIMALLPGSVLPIATVAHHSSGNKRMIVTTNGCGAGARRCPTRYRNDADRAAAVVTDAPRGHRVDATTCADATPITLFMRLPLAMTITSAALMAARSSTARTTYPTPVTEKTRTLRGNGAGGGAHRHGADSRRTGGDRSTRPHIDYSGGAHRGTRSMNTSTRASRGQRRPARNPGRRSGRDNAPQPPRRRDGRPGLQFELRRYSQPLPLLPGSGHNRLAPARPATLQPAAPDPKSRPSAQAGASLASLRHKPWTLVAIVRVGRKLELSWASLSLSSGRWCGSIFGSIALMLSPIGRPSGSSGTNWLLVGSDSRDGLSGSAGGLSTGGDTGGGRTDSIILVHIPFVGKATMVSIPAIRTSMCLVMGRTRSTLRMLWAAPAPPADRGRGHWPAH